MLLGKRNLLSPWNPSVPAELTPAEFEETIRAWLQKWAQSSGQKIEAEHLGPIMGGGGEYKIDVLVKIEIFGGATIVVLVECKHQRRPVEREDVMVLEAKLRDVGAHKGMLFSTSGFQKGALQYATAHAIAAIAVVDGEWLYETKNAGDEPLTPPPWAQIDRFAGVRMSLEGETISCHTIDLSRIEALREWFADTKRLDLLDG
jgi:restriction system protein